MNRTKVHILLKSQIKKSLGKTKINILNHF